MRRTRRWMERGLIALVLLAAAVPAGAARDLGWDRSLVSAYGHDDRSCAFAALRALLDQKDIPEYTSLVVLFDKEETGSGSNTGATSLFLYDFIGKLLDLEEDREPAQFDLQIRDILLRSEAISADVTAGFNPTYKEVHDEKNAAKLGYGVAVERYTGRGGKKGTSEASAEYTAKIRRILDEAGVVWQPAMLGKIDIGGGGTIAVFLAKYNLDIIDIGVPLATTTNAGSDTIFSITSVTTFPTSYVPDGCPVVQALFFVHDEQVANDQSVIRPFVIRDAKVFCIAQIKKGVQRSKGDVHAMPLAVRMDQCSQRLPAFVRCLVGFARETICFP